MYNFFHANLYLAFLSISSCSLLIDIHSMLLLQISCPVFSELRLHPKNFLIFLNTSCLQPKAKNKRGPCNKTYMEKLHVFHYTLPLVGLEYREPDITRNCHCCRRYEAQLKILCLWSMEYLNVQVERELGKSYLPMMMNSLGNEQKSFIAPTSFNLWLEV